MVGCGCGIGVENIITMTALSRQIGGVEGCHGVGSDQLSSTALHVCRDRTRKEGFYLTMHSTHFIYSYMASDIWLRIILIVRNETRCCHIGYSFRLTARDLLYAPSHRQEMHIPHHLLHQSWSTGWNEK